MQNNYKGAIEELQEIIRLNPSDRDTQLTLGVTLAKDGQQKQALDILNHLAQQNDKAGELAKMTLKKMQSNPTLRRSAVIQYRNNVP